MKTTNINYQSTHDRLTRWISVLALSCLLFPLSAAAGQLLRGHVPAVTGHLNALRRLESDNVLRLSIGLPLRNQAALDQLLQEIYDPESPNFRHYLSPEEFTAQFGPTETDYQAVVAYAKANGLTVAVTHSNNLVLEVEAPVSKIEAAFHLKMLVYSHPTENREFFAPDTEPQLDLDVPVLDIMGLDDFILPRAHSHLRPAGVPAAPCAGTGPGGNYAGGDFRAAYAVGVPLTGTGQSVGLVELNGGYYLSDIQQYETNYGLPNVPVVNVLLDGITSATNFPGVEGPLDIEMAIAMAPGLNSVIYYDGGNINDILSRISSDNTAKQISASWTYGINGTTTNLWMQLAVQGISFFNASGDGDAYPGSPASPTDVPYITVVGGTTLSTSGPGGSWTSETAWNWGGGSGTGGGISTTYSIPTWQQGISMTANLGSTTMRNLPDVAMTADDVWVIFNQGAAGSAGGTSCATPLWASFTALINQQAAFNKMPPVGFINPVVYAAGKGASYGASFHDTATGNNYSPSSPSKFPAVSGYDLCTGWGTPTGYPTINAILFGTVSGPFELQNVCSGLALNVSGASTANGAAIIQWPYSGSANSLWTLTPTDSGWYQLINQNSGKDAVVQGASTANGAQIIQWNFGSSFQNDQWIPMPTSDGSYILVNRHSGLVMEDPGLSLTNGTQMDQWTGNGASNTRWRILVSPVAGTHYVVNQSSGQALDDPGGSKTAGIQLDQWNIGYTSNQQWTFTPNSDGSYTIVNVYSGLAVDDSGGGTGNGNPIIQWTVNGQSYQHWYVTQNADGSFTIKNVVSGKDLEDPAASTTEGQLLDQWTDVSTATWEHWFLW